MLADVFAKVEPKFIKFVHAPQVSSAGMLFQAQNEQVTRTAVNEVASVGVSQFPNVAIIVGRSTEPRIAFFIVFGSMSLSALACERVIIL